MYIITWKYTVEDHAAEQFELAYGKNGSWSQLFKQSDHYQGSNLYKSDVETNTYFLIDMWDNREYYEKFKRLHKTEYDNLDAGFQNIHAEEKKIGTYYSLE